MKRTDAKNLFSSVWDDNEVIVMTWEKGTIEEHLGRKLSNDEWIWAVKMWEEEAQDYISVKVSEAIIECLNGPK